MTNAERQAKWLKKNRALHNLRRRQKRKNLSSGLSGGNEVADVIQSLPPAQFKDETLEKLRGLIKVEEEKPRVEAPVRLPVRRSETGMIISEEQYQEREEYKRRSREKGFVPDEYSQA